jgi:Rieske Fe-S protein
MKKLLCAVVALSVATVLSAPAIWTVDARAQAPQGAKAPQGQMAEKEIQGTIAKVAGNKITLADGTELKIPTAMKVERSELKPGAAVRIAYAEQAGEKVVTNLMVAR